jgi:uncharacterized membrane protein
MSMVARIARHWLASHKPASQLVPPAQSTRIESEVAATEQRHAGEIRVVVEAALPFGLLLRGVHARTRALQLFATLGVWDTDANNGVLIYLLLGDRAVEFIADRGIAARIPEGDWASLCRDVEALCAKGEVAEACCAAVRGVAAQLERHFPRGGNARNELPNQPILL